MRATVGIDFLRSGVGHGWRSGAATGCLLFAFVAGCGKGGPPPVPRENVAGKVTFDGKEIPSGFIDFRNDEMKVVSTLSIKDGAYSSSAGDGPAAGMNKVVVAGKEGEDGMPLWTGEFRTQVEIKKGNNPGTNFSIEKKAVKSYDKKKWSDNVHDRS
jgi:hypothetical protein